MNDLNDSALFMTTFRRQDSLPDMFWCQMRNIIRNVSFSALYKMEFYTFISWTMKPTEGGLTSVKIHLCFGATWRKEGELLSDTHVDRILFWTRTNNFLFLKGNQINHWTYNWFFHFWFPPSCPIKHHRWVHLRALTDDGNVWTWLVSSVWAEKLTCTQKSLETERWLTSDCTVSNCKHVPWSVVICSDYANTPPVESVMVMDEDRSEQPE